MDLMSTAQLLGNLGEFVGAIAVVVTLVYLSLQIRQSNLASQTTAIQGFFDSWDSVGDVDRDFIPIMRKGYTEQWQEISKDERAELHLYWMNYLAKLHMGYRLYVRKVLDQPSYIGFEDFLVSALKSPALRGWWGEHGEVFPPDFRERLNARINDPNDPRPLMKDLHSMWSND